MTSTTTWGNRPELPDGAPPPTDDPPAGGEQRWLPWSAPVALLTVFVIAFVGGLIVALIGAAFGSPLDADDSPPGVLMGATFVQDLAFVGVAIAFARMAGPVFGAQFGLRRVRVLPALGWIVLLYVAFIAFAGLWGQLVEVEEDDILEQLGADDGGLLLVLSALLVCVMAPVVEEFFFRGYYYGALRNWRGPWIAALLTGLTFGGIHLLGSPLGAIVPLMVFGAGLCLLRERTGSLLPCIVVHAINNSIAFGVMNDWTWEIPVLLVSSVTACLLISVAAARLWRAPEPAPAAATPG